MRVRTVVLTSVVLSVLASAVTTALLGRDRGPAPRSAGDVRTTAPAPDVMPLPAIAVQRDPALEERLRRIAARLDAPGAAAAPRSKQEALESLLAITQGGRQLAIKDSFFELVALGNDVVPEIVALLKSGRDQDWGGAFSFSGNVVGGYPRLRTLLIDVLRQIGTPEALKGLLDGLHGTEDMLDFRDLFLLFGSTSDETMVNGMSAMLPAAVLGLKGEDPKKAFVLADSVSRWIQRHDFEGKLDVVEELARQGFDLGRMDRTSFALLVGLAPERAFDLTRQVREKQGERGLYGMAPALGEDTPRAQIARYLDLLFASGITESERLAFYVRLPGTACESIQPSSARAADARALLDFLKRRLAEETGDDAKSVLTDRIGTLEASLRQ